MIKLNSPITINPPNINGKKINSVKLTEIDYFVIYDNTQQIATARIKGVNLSLILWNKHTTPSYSSVGQFTDKDTDDRISTLLNVSGGNSAIENAILNLYPKFI